MNLKLTRRSTLLGGLAAAARAVIPARIASAAASPRGDSPASAAPSFALAALVPEEWKTWPSWLDYVTIEDLLVEMDTKACCETIHAPTQAALMEAENRFLETRSIESFHAVSTAHTAREIAFTEQCLQMGYALGLTREYAAQGPVAWYEAALRFAGIEIPPQDVQEAAYARLNAATDRNWELHGFVKIAAAEQAGPVNSALDLARLVGYAPRSPDAEASA